ncbi:lipid-A-disaccharide synthase-related protein [Vulcanococcus sp.]|uniref:lipid-A-disaccharide synthase-related protein n=1 Tax=Vulcanococcus sp. TaxID=2856995 RepID=UPI003C02E117
MKTPARPQRILLLSNGHGEDLSGALIGQALQMQGCDVEALPLVGHGQAYTQAGIACRGKTREYSTGGLGYTSLWGRITEVVQGQILYLLSRTALLLRIARRYDLVLVVGDVIPVLAGWLSRRPMATYLVAYSSHYEGKLRLPWPCGACLKSSNSRAIYSRDQLSADDLSVQLQRPVQFFGNPFFDGALRSSEPLAGAPQQRLGLLPGSRLPEALHNLELMLRVLERLPESLRPANRLGLHAALVGALTPQEVAPLASRLGWRLELSSQNRCSLQRGPLHLQLEWGRFAAVVQQCDLLLSMTGTAAEQCVGLAKPVLQLVGHGPQFTENFAEAQRRLLGPGVLCATGEPGSEEQLSGTAELLEQLLDRLLNDPLWRQQLKRLGGERIGGGGGAARMAADLLQRCAPADD